MPSVSNSALLSDIFKQAEKISRDHDFGGVTRDCILIAAIQLCSSAVSGIRDGEELAATKKLLENFPSGAEEVNGLLDSIKGKKMSMTESMLMSVAKSRALEAAKSENATELTAYIFIREILATGPSLGNSSSPKAETPAPSLKKDTGKEEKKPAEGKKTEKKPQETEPVSKKEAAEKPATPPNMLEIIAKTKNLSKELGRTVLGQPQAIRAVVSGYFQAQLRAATDPERKRPLATFLLAGSPGVGKTFIAEETARVLGLPFRRFDMSEYNGATAVDELSGSDANYAHSSEGLLTGFVYRNPECIILFDEIEKASLNVIHQFLQILDAGQLRDNRTDKEVSFKDTILIFTTNAGKELYDNSETEDLSNVQREVILDALSKDIDPRTGEPFFPAAICSRFASGNVVLMNKLGAHILHEIAGREIDKITGNLAENFGMSIEVAPEIPMAVLLSEGASADVRSVKGRAAAFAYDELYELFRLATDPAEATDASRIKKIRLRADLEKCPANVRKLFVPDSLPHALVFTQKKDDSLNGYSDLIKLHFAATLDRAEGVMGRDDIQLVLCDYGAGGSESGVLNREDADSPARDFIRAMREKHPDMPILMIEHSSGEFSEEEKESFRSSGIRGFIPLNSGEGHGIVKETLQTVFQDRSLMKLARANQVVRFETAQRIEDGDTAVISMFDFRLEKSVRAEDKDSVLSMLSTPDERFEDVIGADDAKKELSFFVSYIKDPKKYKKLGAGSPRGILLYGPPGTGKTMLAKAFANESGATFIATQGNAFFKGIVGQGAAMVHRLFAAARRYAPSVLFVDEIDAIARERSGRDTDLAQDSEQILTAFFAEMDGFSTDRSRPVFVLGATNYGMEQGMSLDPAMLRRFDRQILVDLPDRAARELFLQKKISSKPAFKVSEDAIHQIAQRSAGMSLANLDAVIDLAARNAVMGTEESVTDEILSEALEQYISGDKKQWDREVVRRTARHETGHTLVSWLLGEKPAYVTIVSRGNYGGYMQHEEREDRHGYTKKELLDRVKISLGGRAAEIAYYGDVDGVSTGASEDLRNATSIVSQMVCVYGMDETVGLTSLDISEVLKSDNDIRRRINAILSEQMDETLKIIRDNMDKMDKLSETLLEKNSMSGDDVVKLLTE